MKRLILILLIAPSLCFGAYVDFYCNASTGSNVNGGSDAGTVTYTSTNGNWSTTTHDFTPTDGTNPVSAGVTVGQYASIYIDGATLAVYIVKITAVVNAANGAISTSTTLLAGSAPSTSATGRTIKVGGAWKGPNGTSGFPLTLSGIAGLSGAGDVTAFNLKNNASYVMTANIAETSANNILVQGYSSSVRDSGKATLEGGTSGAAYQLLTTSASNGWTHKDLIFKNNGLTSNQTGVGTSGTVSVRFERCVFTGMRGDGLDTGARTTCVECEFYGNNTSNTITQAGVVGDGYFENCYSHDNTGSNSRGFYSVSSNTQTTYVHCIADSNGNAGFELGGTTSSATLTNCDAYNNTNDGLITSGLTGSLQVKNCNFTKNGGWGINISSSPKLVQSIYNNGFGAGTQANTSGTTTGIYSGAEVGSVTYASNATPYNAPTTGDFSIVLAAAKNAGRGAFTETDGTNTGTVGYPDIGAAQSNSTGGGTKSAAYAH